MNNISSVLGALYAPQTTSYYGKQGGTSAISFRDMAVQGQSQVDNTEAVQAPSLGTKLKGKY